MFYMSIFPVWGTPSRTYKNTVMQVRGACSQLVEGRGSHLIRPVAMKVIALLPCVVLNFFAVTALRIPARVRCVSRGAASPWSRCRGQRCYPARPATAAVDRMPTAATMKVESAPDPDRYRAALTTSGLVVTGALAFGAGINQVLGADKAVQFFSGYVVEMSLSVDNLFVFLLLFSFFKVPLDYQNRVLSYGILGAVVMRAIFIALGEAAMSLFHPVLLVFAGILVFSSYKLFTEGEGDEDDLTDNQVVAFASKILDATDSYDGDKFFTLVDGVRRATPLLLVLVCVELSDVIFAVDSIPAVFAVTKDPFIVYTSNIWAILNLRSLFTLLSSAVEDLAYLRPAVAIVLGFVGAKLAGEFFGYDVSNELSLGVITGLLGGGVGLSLMERKSNT